jgi:hypothetical protein
MKVIVTMPLCGAIIIDNCSSDTVKDIQAMLRGGDEDDREARMVVVPDGAKVEISAQPILVMRGVGKSDGGDKPWFGFGPGGEGN